jgi:GNAT superfamily N-acetyltransferase
MLLIRPFSETDVPLGMRLKQQAGWNQLEADWRRMLAMQPGGGFVAEVDGTPAGTVMTCIFGDVAWIAMMLVEQSLRGKGLGRALMEHALAYLDEQAVRTVRLDATPLGQPLYEKLGFVAEYSLARYGGVPTGFRGSIQFIGDTAKSSDYEGIYACDRAATGTDRRKFLSRLICESRAIIAGREGKVRGFVMTRPGSNATQIGPCIADDQAGPGLLIQPFVEYVHRESAVYIDIPVSHTIAAEVACEFGLGIQRQLLRMRRGSSTNERVEQLWASSGPELG